MKAVQKWGDGKDGMGLVEVPEPEVGPDDLLIEVAAVGICGSDLHIWRDEKEHRRPVTLGHEFSGVVIGKGENVGDEWQIGDRICGDLETLHGRIGTHVNGAYAERMALPARLAHKLPDNLSFAEGALIEQVTCMSHAAMYRTRINPADFVVITGPGPIGLTMLQIVKLFSPRAVMVTGLKDDTVRLEKAKELGADYVYYSEDDPVQEVLRLTDGVGADVVIDCSGGEAAITQATRMVKNGGWITIIGLWGHDITVNLDRVPYNNLTVRGSWGWAGMEYADQAVRMAAGWHSWERALQIMAMGKIKLEPIITSHIPLESWREAFERLERKQEIKVMMYPNEKYMPR
ncbi:MAG TPA: zinc-binding dehydrogenase [Caldilineae bacterium]|nr:zinc-binding dehydrogenase [Caldilineae bacterium]